MKYREDRIGCCRFCTVKVPIGFCCGKKIERSLMGQKDLTQKNQEFYPDVFADIINALLYGGKPVLQPEKDI